MNTSLDNLKKYQIILGSNSPRRKDLLQALNLSFQVIPIDVDESLSNDIKGTEAAIYLAEKKAAGYCHPTTDDYLLITADTIVVVGDVILGKPADKEEAKAILKALSGKTHQVITGVCIKTKEQQNSFSTTTEVKFSILTDAEIAYYIDNYRPYDKAGSYGVQEWIGFIGVEYISGSYYNVMGLPIQKLYQELKKW